MISPCSRKADGRRFDPGPGHQDLVLACDACNARSDPPEPVVRCSSAITSRLAHPATSLNAWDMAHPFPVEPDAFRWSAVRFRGRVGGCGRQVRPPTRDGWTESRSAREEVGAVGSDGRPVPRAWRRGAPWPWIWWSWTRSRASRTLPMTSTSGCCAGANTCSERFSTGALDDFGRVIDLNIGRMMGLVQRFGRPMRVVAAAAASSWSARWRAI